MTKALLVIDVQYEYFTGKMPIKYPDPKMSLKNIVEAMKAAHEKGVLVYIIQHVCPPEAGVFVKGTHEFEIHEDVLKAPHDAIIEKTLPGSYTGTNLDELVKQHKIDSVCICGYMTQMCCDTTSRQSLHRGLNVQFLSDATGTLDVENYAGKVTAEELHNAILVTQAMRFSKVMTTKAWIESL